MSEKLIRFFDFFLSLFLLLIISPCLIVISLLIFLEDYGSPFFLQKRVGIGGKIFRIMKFRSMHKHKDISHNVHNKSFDDLKKIRSQFTGTLSNDTRITKIGKFIRKYSIDELPQLVNVLIGDMSLVGVRPDTPIQVIDYEIDFWNRRHKYKPGITGMAQINGRSMISMEDRNKYDAYWIDNYSLKLYFQTLKNTVLYFLKGAFNSN